MYFSHPEVIKNTTDIVLGAVETDKREISFLDLMEEAKVRIEGYIQDDVKELMAGGMTYYDALREVAQKVYSRLLFYEKHVVNSEEELADLIVRSRNFERWEMDTWQNMANIHKGKIKRNTPVSVTREGAKTQESISEVLAEKSSLDAVLDQLAMIFDVGTSKVS